VSQNEDKISPPEESNENEVSESSESNSFPSIYHKDAFLVFRALCKLSLKGLNDNSTGELSDQIALQNR
jgi:hypothetical protein